MFLSFMVLLLHLGQHRNLACCTQEWRTYGVPHPLLTGLTRNQARLSAIALSSCSECGKGVI
jgi:hypothetical protein